METSHNKYSTVQYSIVLSNTLSKQSDTTLHSSCPVRVSQTQFPQQTHHVVTAPRQSLLLIETVQYNTALYSRHTESIDDLPQNQGQKK